MALPIRPDGDYYVLVVTDAQQQVFERDGEGDNTGVAATSTRLTHPDLVVESVDPIGPQESGSSVSVKWTVRNAGSGAAPATRIRGPRGCGCRRRPRACSSSS